MYKRQGQVDQALAGVWVDGGLVEFEQRGSSGVGDEGFGAVDDACRGERRLNLRDVAGGDGAALDAGQGGFCLLYTSRCV